MQFKTTPFKGLFLIEFPHFCDNRGAFQKIFTSEEIKNNVGLDLDIKEIYYSINKKGVIRGMHFQTPPHQHTKIVSVSKGRILDVVVDLRKAEPTYGMFFHTELNSENGVSLIIPEGMAHGFASLEDGTIVNYAQTSCYAHDNDGGILYDSFGFEWPFQNPIMSGRDTQFSSLSDFKSPF